MIYPIAAFGAIVLACLIGTLVGKFIKWLNSLPEECDPFVEEIVRRAFQTGNMVIGTRHEDGTYTITEYPSTRTVPHEQIGQSTRPEAGNEPQFLLGGSDRRPLRAYNSGGRADGPSDQAAGDGTAGPPAPTVET